MATQPRVELYMLMTTAALIRFSYCTASRGCLGFRSRLFRYQQIRMKLDILLGTSDIGCSDKQVLPAIFFHFFFM